MIAAPDIFSRIDIHSSATVTADRAVHIHMAGPFPPDIQAEKGGYVHDGKGEIRWLSIVHGCNSSCSTFSVFDRCLPGFRHLVGVPQQGGSGFQNVAGTSTTDYVPFQAGGPAVKYHIKRPALTGAQGDQDIPGFLRRHTRTDLFHSHALVFVLLRRITSVFGFIAGVRCGSGGFGSRGRILQNLISGILGGTDGLILRLRLAFRENLLRIFRSHLFGRRLLNNCLFSRDLMLGLVCGGLSSSFL